MSQEKIESPEKIIRDFFVSMKTKYHLIKLINVLKPFVLHDNTAPFPLAKLTYYTNPELCQHRYRYFQIKKKLGGFRQIYAPAPTLKAILKVLGTALQCVYTPPKEVKGFVQGYSIKSNASFHIGKKYVLNIDIKDFFHTFDRNRVKMGFYRAPFNFKGEQEPLAFLLASLCTHPIEINGKTKIVLPQGSPTSPVLSNILCKDFDRRLRGLAKRFGANYTRYADDITFSSNHHIYQPGSPFLRELFRLIDLHGFTLNDKKTRLQVDAYRQEVTGLVVNEKINVPRRFVKTLRTQLHNWEQSGYKKASKIFERYYIKENGKTKKNVPELFTVISGKLNYMEMIKGSTDSTYTKLKKRFDELYHRLPTSKIKKANKSIPHRPADTKCLLIAFNTDPNAGLKYLTHNFQDPSNPPSHSNFIETCKKSLFNLFQKHPSARGSLKERLRALVEKQEYTLTFPNPKSQALEKFDCIGWNNVEFKQWYNEYKKHPLLAQEWKIKMVQHFQKSVRLRNDQGGLFKIVENCKDAALGEKRNDYCVTMDRRQLEAADFYTDVVALSIGLYHIFQTIPPFAENDYLYNIEVVFKKNKAKQRVLSIIHSDSEAKLMSSDLDTSKGDINKIRSALWSVCNYEIHASFLDGEKSVKVLTDSKNRNDIKKIEPIQAVKGFTHVLKFP